MAKERFIETIAELESWLETINRTAQITFRIQLEPPYLVRIVKDTVRHGDRLEKLYVQAVGDSIAEAMQRCIEAYMTDGVVDEAVSGHHGTERGRKRKCRFRGCERPAARAWTMCDGHYASGRPYRNIHGKK